MKKSVLLTVVALLLISVPAEAVIFEFDNITGNSATNAAIGEAQLFVDITDPGMQVLFTFTNSGPEASSITDAYFDDRSSTLDEIDSIINGTGVSFSQSASPPNLPGANQIGPPFMTSFPPGNFSADSDPPVQPNGVNPGESLGILFDLEGGATFNDALANLGSGGLRIGIHVQGFASAGSESFVNKTAPIPEPSTLLLLGSGLCGVGFAARRRRRCR